MCTQVHQSNHRGLMREASLYIEHLGYNGKVFDLEVKRVSNIEPISDEEEQVEALVKN